MSPQATIYCGQHPLRANWQVAHPLRGFLSRHSPRIPQKLLYVQAISHIWRRGIRKPLKKSDWPWNSHLHGPPKKTPSPLQPPPPRKCSGFGGPAARSSRMHLPAPASEPRRARRPGAPGATAPCPAAPRGAFGAPSAKVSTPGPFACLNT